LSFCWQFFANFLPIFCHRMSLEPKICNLPPRELQTSPEGCKMSLETKIFLRTEMELLFNLH
jgi:hypothetical protein